MTYGFWSSYSWINLNTTIKEFVNEEEAEEYIEEEQHV